MLTDTNNEYDLYGVFLRAHFTNDICLQFKFDGKFAMWQDNNLPSDRNKCVCMLRYLGVPNRAPGKQETILYWKY